MKVAFTHPDIPGVKAVSVGFSWTVFLFGPAALLLRGQVGMFLAYLLTTVGLGALAYLVAGALGMGGFGFFVVLGVWGLMHMAFALLSNDVRTKALVGAGWLPGLPGKEISACVVSNTL